MKINFAGIDISCTFEYQNKRKMKTGQKVIGIKLTNPASQFIKNLSEKCIGKEGIVVQIIKNNAMVKFANVLYKNEPICISYSIDALLNSSK